MFTLVATAKNEGPYIWEWVAHHKMIGFDNIIVFQNDSDDRTVEILTTLHDAGIIRYQDNSDVSSVHQIHAYIRASQFEEYKAAQWVMALDLDEFLCIKTPEATLDSLISFMPESADCITVNWKIFGNSGLTELSDELVTQRFVLTELHRIVVNRLRPFKTLFKAANYQRPGVHRPVPLERAQSRTDEDVSRWVNGSGHTSDQFRIHGFRCSDSDVRRYAQVNHYIVRDAASFVLKNHRGSAHQAHREIGRDYWARLNLNHRFDRSIHATAERLRESMREIDLATGGTVSKLTGEAREFHKTRFKELLRKPQPRALYYYCIATPNLDASLSEEPK